MIQKLMCVQILNTHQLLCHWVFLPLTLCSLIICQANIVFLNDTVQFWIRRNDFASGFEGSSSEDVLNFLESKDAEWIAKSLEGGFTPVVDGYFLKEDPEDFYKRGDYYKVPSIMGFNSHEGGLFPLMSPDKGKVADIEAGKMQTKWAMSSFYEECPNKDKVENVWWSYLQEILMKLTRIFGVHLSAFVSGVAVGIIRPNASS